MNQPDVAIIGGGPGGLLTALALRQRGLSVRLFEKRKASGDGLDKPCGEGLMPFCLAALEELGVDVEGLGHPFRAIVYRDEATEARADFRGGDGLGVRRTELSLRLLETAERNGVEIVWGEAARCERGPSGAFVVKTPRGSCGSRFVVAADGLRSATRRTLELERKRASGRRRFGVRRHYARAPWSDAVEVHWTEGAEAYVTPVGEGEIGVALLWTETEERSSRRFDDQLAAFPWLAEKLEGCEATRPLGCGPLRQPVRGVVRGNAALVGDASGYVDAITGEGLGLAAQQAPLLAGAIADGRLPQYGAAQRRQRRVPETLTEMTLLLARWPRLRRRTLRSFARNPQGFSEFLDVLSTGEPTVAALARPGVKLLGSLLRA
ncbi:MAG: NAD(P)/FAD-dependent oxidoreductase [Acidobacteriota bacterium]